MGKKQPGENQEVTERELAKIRQLDNFNLVMLVSEIHDHGWPIARKTLDMMPSGLLPDEVS